MVADVVAVVVPPGAAAVVVVLLAVDNVSIVGTLCSS